MPLTGGMGQISVLLSGSKLRRKGELVRIRQIDHIPLEQKTKPKQKRQANDRMVGLENVVSCMLDYVVHQISLDQFNIYVNLAVILKSNLY